MYNIEEIKNKIIYGDNLEIMKKIPDNSIDLVYLDPPFFTQTDWEKNGMSFSDKFKGINDYIEFMSIRLKELHRVLKSTGTIYLHCNYVAFPNLKLLMGEIFNIRNYRTTIVWQRYPSAFGAKVNKIFPEVSDYILLYTKSDKFIQNIQYISYSKEYESKFKNPDNDPKGKYIWKGFPKKDSKPSERILKLNEESEVKFLKQSKEGWYGYKRYWNDTTTSDGIFKKGKERGQPITNIWTDIDRLNKIDYPTQKPEILLERIISASSNLNDIILDPFVGSGTTCVAAKKLGRNYIGIDISQNAINLAEKRIKEIPIKQKSLFED